ncbi:MAG: hypothetical protein M1815_002922 [Lichina confinis]|nr:MAG: hypothetical protein M1815_002922 [Lichina confinis]
MSISGASKATYTKYTAVPGYFLQGDPGTDPITFQYDTSNLGLIDRPYDTDDEFDPEHKKSQWQRFENLATSLNSKSGTDTQYKVLYLGRHGQGTHNVAEAFYGTQLWDCYWTLQSGNGSDIWTDAHLTPQGVMDAQRAGAFWKRKIAEDSIPLPETYYVSPLWRAIATADITFARLPLPEDRPFLPRVKELLRETIGIHTCDQRSSKTYIEAEFPSAVFEAGFVEDDPFWKPDERESYSALDARIKMLLDDVFTNDGHTFISFTSHSGTTNSILRVIGHRPFPLVPGAIIPVLVRAEIIEGTPPPMTIEPPTPPPACPTNIAPHEL